MTTHPNITTLSRPSSQHVLVCVTCGQTPDNAYRHRIDGSVRYGCVERAHDEHPDDWHERDEARAIRARKPSHFTDLVWGIPVDRNRETLSESPQTVAVEHLARQAAEHAVQMIEQMISIRREYVAEHDLVVSDAEIAADVRASLTRMIDAEQSR